MHVLVLGAAGMLGRKLVARLVAEGLGGRVPDALTLVDIVAPASPAGFAGRAVVRAADLAAAGEAEACVAGRPDVVFHLAAVVSGEAEADMDKGYRVNLDGTRRLLEALRAGAEASGGGYRPRLVFTSSLAVFGTPLPAVIGDEFLSAPLSSYGTQKAIGELLLSDYSRRGFVDGVALRLPTICVRPGLPNRAASGFFSGIIREPLAGKEALLPVGEEVRHWFASPRAAVGFLLRAGACDLGVLGGRRALTMPGLSVSVAEQIEALRRVAGDGAVALIRREREPSVERIIETWPQAFDTTRARAMGFEAEGSFEEIIRVYLEDDSG
jgi:nucleoside-diphosphate-sugar epimerase